MPQAQYALGIDVSHWQATIDWSKVKQAGIAYAFTKATENVNILDAYFARNWAGIKAAGLIRGAYHFFRPGVDARGQAAFFAQKVQWEPGDLPPVLDLENNGGLSVSALVDVVYNFLDELERLTQCRPIIYTGPYFWNTSMANPAPPGWTGNYPLWIAQYTSAAQPTVPKGWTAWTFWQYTCQGSVTGVAGNVDTNRFNGTVEALQQWLQNQNPGPIPTPPVDPVDLLRAYFQALNDRNLDALLALYHADAMHVAGAQSVQGLEAIRARYQTWLDSLPGAVFIVDDYGPVDAAWAAKWICTSGGGNISDGYDTFGLRDGKIQYHASQFALFRG